MYRSHLEWLFQKGEFVVTAEIGSPRGSDLGALQEQISIIRGYCDAVNVPDNPRGIPSMSSIVCSHFLLQQGLEPIMQMTGRDRNRIAIQSDLYGAYALGIRNILLVSGDHVLLGTHPLTKMVFDVDSVLALDLLEVMREGFDISGEELTGAPDFFAGATFNPYSEPHDSQVKRIIEKRNAGAQFFQTQAIYDMTPFETVMTEIEGLNLRVLAGIVPLRNSEMAELMNLRVPGIKVPKEFIRRLQDAEEGLFGDDRESAARKVGLEIAIETIEAVKRIEGLNGIHIMGVGWPESVPELVKATGLHPRLKRG
ncbi:MAG: methylenetetrahydrofolate reductase [Candidatus Thorarchaeota archaeon]